MLPGEIFQEIKVGELVGLIISIHFNFLISRN